MSGDDTTRTLSLKGRWPAQPNPVPNRERIGGPHYGGPKH